ncbi:MAG: DNA repair exonuclease [Candidatus Nanoarchaeia archaeon]|nr:DNA repair exonuclease [Candidatus Nanoarchaeia archaeon]
MKFAHIADCHIGGWAEPKMKQLTMDAFSRAIDTCISEKVDFVLIAGDLFNTAIPQIELIRDTVSALKKLKDNSIKCYTIAGSHDFSPSGKTMLEVLEKAGLTHDVFRVENNKLMFTMHGNAKIAGMLGRKGGLEKEDYREIETSHLGKEMGYKIFMFHSALDELKPAGMEEMDSMPCSMLPDGFDYYAGGHVHALLEKKHGSGVITFPSALFPNNFKELEEQGHGGFFIVDENGYKRVEINMKDVAALRFDAGKKTAMQLQDEIMEKVSALDANDKIVLLRLNGALASGKPSDINFKGIFEKLGNAYFVMKNTSGLSSIEMKEPAAEAKKDAEDIIKEQRSESPLFEKEEEAVRALLSALNIEKAEGEKAADFERRVVAEASSALGIPL